MNTYYHPLKDTKAFANSDIVLVDDLSKAKKAAPTGLVFNAKIKDDKIFDLSDPTHREILQNRLPFNNFQRIVTNQKLDWNELDLLWNDEADDQDELLSPLGFIGLKFTRNGDDFILIFDRRNVMLGDIVWSSPFARTDIQKTTPKIPKLSEIVKETMNDTEQYLFHGTKSFKDAEGIAQNGVDFDKLISGYVRGFYTHPSLEDIQKHNDTVSRSSQYQAAVKCKIKSGTKTISIEELEELEPAGNYGGLIYQKTQQAIAKGYSIVSRGKERIIINPDCIERCEVIELNTAR